MNVVARRLDVAEKHRELVGTVEDDLYAIVFVNPLVRNTAKEIGEGEIFIP